VRQDGALLAGMTAHRFEAHAYVGFAHVGQMSELAQTVTQIFEAWLPGSRDYVVFVWVPVREI